MTDNANSKFSENEILNTCLLCFNDCPDGFMYDERNRN